MDHLSYDWSYHGLGRSASPDDHAHILVEPATFGLYEKKDATVLRELPWSPTSGGFSWGYDGGGCRRAAEAILADALRPDDTTVKERRAPAGLDVRTFSRLQVDFTWDVVSQFADEWRMRRSAVLRWMRGWYADLGIANQPAAAIGLPPADPHAAEHQQADPRTVL